MAEIDPSDVILWLLPHRGEGFECARFATFMPQNRSHFVAGYNAPGQRDHPRALADDEPFYESPDYLVFLFSHGAKKPSVGLVGGRAIDVDFSLPAQPGVSKYHFAITFDDQNLPIIRDLGSRYGTQVTYDEEKGERLSNFDWPLVGPSKTFGRPPILNITDRLQFKVVLPDRDYTCPEYIEKVNKFRGVKEELRGVKEEPEDSARLSHVPERPKHSAP